MKLFFLFLIMNLVLLSADVTVTATGYGATKEQATQDALRNAVEQGAGVKIFSSTEVQDFIALKDVMVSESFGMVTRYDVLSANKNGFDWVVKVNASVSDNIQKDWAKMKIILKQKNNPSVLVIFAESIDGKSVYKDAGATAIAAELKKLGFRVIDGQTIEKLQQTRKEIANMEQNLDTIISIASERQADYVIMGSLEATRNPDKVFYGLRGCSYTLRSYAKIIQTDTAEIVAAVDGMDAGNATKYATMSPEAVALATLKKATKNTPNSFFSKLMANLISHWIKEIQEGKVVELVVSNVSFRDRKEVQRILSKQESLISDVNVKHFRNNRLTMEIKSKLNLEDLAEALEELEDFEVVEFQNSRIEIRYAH